MATRIDGKAVAAKIRAQVAQDVETLKARGICPGMAVVLVGDDPASKIYVNNKKKACAETGIYSEEHLLPAETTQEELLALIEKLNADERSTASSCSPRCRSIWTKSSSSSISTRARMWMPSTRTTWGKS